MKGLNDFSNLERIFVHLNEPGSNKTIFSIVNTWPHPKKKKKKKPSNNI